MNKKDIVAETINDLDGLTISHLFQLIRKIKFSALLSIFALFSSIIGGAYALGKNSQQKDTAVSLQSPFAMSYKSQNATFTASRLILIKDPTAIAPDSNSVVLSLRQVVDEFTVVEVGKIIAKVGQEKLSWPWSLFAINLTSGIAHAASPVNFSWNGHQGDYNFTEKFVNEDTVNRLYSDGCMLEYKVDAERRSIPESFKWIKNVH